MPNYDYDPEDHYEKYKNTENSFSNDFLLNYETYFQKDDPNDYSNIHLAIARLALANKDKDHDINNTQFASNYLKRSYNKDKAIIHEIMHKINNANQNKLWNKCRVGSNPNYDKKCPKKSMFSRFKSIFSRKTGNSANSRKGGKRKNKCKTKKYRNKFV
jgi:hypothetical protein